MTCTKTIGKPNNSNFHTTGKFKLPKLANRKRKAWINTIINKPKQVWRKKKNRACLERKQSQKQIVQFSKVLKKYWTKITLFIEHYKPQ